MAKTTSILLVLIVAFGFAFSTRAAELYINSDGKAKVSDAEITYLNNNVITVTLWGTRWILFVDVADSNVKLTNSSGEPITVWQLANGHKLYVEGVMREAGVGKIEVNVKLLRDLSLQGSGPVIPAPALLGAAAASLGVAVNRPQNTAAGTQVKSQETAAPAASRAYLERGMAGAEVKALQEALLGIGYLRDDEATGFFGEATERAVKRLQKANGLAQEGTVGPLTRQVVEKLQTSGPKISISAAAPLKAEVPQPKPASTSGAGKRITQNLRLGMGGGEVVILQEFLQKNNFGIPKDGPVTGFYGKLTADAVARFQKANGLEVVGDVGPLTREL
ncbi:MAG: peptidoglycan-binding protein, partial [Candidatus Sungiibacteriota bacterium]